MSFGLVALIAMGVIALSVFASPLVAVFMALVAASFLLIGISALRQRSAKGGAPDTDSAGPEVRGTHGGAATGAPVSGEG